MKKCKIINNSQGQCGRIGVRYEDIQFQNDRGAYWLRIYTVFVFEGCHRSSGVCGGNTAQLAVCRTAHAVLTYSHSTK